jgi:hypothetical protein
MRAEHTPADKFWEGVVPLDRQAMARVFAAVRQDLVVSARDVEALQITAALLSNQIFLKLAAKPPPAPKARRMRVLQHTTALQREIVSILQDGYLAPPLLPTTWLTALQAWVLTDLLKRGRPTKDANRMIMTRLLDLYFIAFGKEPSHTANGPTTRFLKAWQREVSASAAANTIFKEAVARLPSLTDSNTRRLIQDWRADSSSRRIARKTFIGVILALDPSRGEIRPWA